jgi:hypothetical protein
MFSTKLSAFRLKGFNISSLFVFLSVKAVIDEAAIYGLHWQLGWPLRDTPTPTHLVTSHRTSISAPSSHPPSTPHMSPYHIAQTVFPVFPLTSLLRLHLSWL